MNEEEIKKALGGLLKTAKEKRKLEDEQRQAKNESDRSAIFESVGKDIGKVIGPYIDALNSRDEASHTAMGDSLKRIITESIKIEAPGVDTTGIQEVIAGAFANLKIPAPVVNYAPPIVNVPEIKMPKSMEVTGDVGIKGVSRKQPFPVLMVDEAGKAMMFPVPVGGGGSSFPMRVLDEANNALRVTGSFSISASNASSQIIDSSLNPVSQANPFPVTVVSGGTATTGSAVVDSSGVQYSGSNPLPVTVVAGASTSTKAQIGNSDGDYSVANPLPVSATLTLPSGQGDSATATRFVQAGDSVSSTNILTFNGNTPSTGLNETTVGVLRTVLMTDSISSVNLVTLNGTAPATGLNETTVGVLRTVLMTDSAVSVTSQATGLNETTGGVLRVVQMTDSIASVKVVSPVAQGDDTSAIRVIHAGNASQSVSASGDVASASADSGNPVKVGGVAKTGLITAVADGSRVNSVFDKLGRQLTRLNARELIATAYVSLTNGTETTLATASAGQYLDLVYIMGANTSGSAQQIDIRALSGGNIVLSLYIPANSTAGVSLPVPFPQDATGNAWTVDNADVTNSNVLISALFSKES